jgi:peptidoglycan/xylan/chitin deacetylase (PgdA/CDA1 family)
MRHLLSLLLHDVYRSHPAESGFPGRAADRYKLSFAEFDRQISELAEVRKDRPMLVTGEVPPYSDGGPFAITVDDGGLSYYSTVADRLEALGWRGHCFVTTGAIGCSGFLDARQIRELRARGHVIGSHSVSHPRRFSGCPRVQMIYEWRESRKRLADIMGEDVTIASVPGGSFSPRVADAAREAGLHVLFTSEPQTRVVEVGGCTVLGRFTVRAGCRPDFTRRLGRLEPGLRLREWMFWNVKKRLKPLVAATAPPGSDVTALARTVEPAKGRC